MRLTADMRNLFKKGHDDPVFFVEDVVGMTSLWQKQKDIMQSVRAHPRTCVRSCNGAGKTFTTANVVTWFAPTRPNSLVITTAPTSRQVRELLWQEIRNIHAHSRFPLGGNCLQVSWTLGEKWFALGLSTDDPNRFQGFHAENILGVIDEAAGVDASIWEGMDAILTSHGARLLVIGNPTETSGDFYNAFSSPLFNKIHISAFDTPNFTANDITMEDIRSGAWDDKYKTIVYPALITPKWVAERYSEWGEDSPAFQSRILGQFPLESKDNMIPLGWVLKAREREVEEDMKGLCVVAVDVARFGDDESIIGVRRGVNYVRQEVLHNVDVHTLSMAAQEVIRKENPRMTVVDVVGIGAGVADNLRAWGHNVLDFIAQGSPWDKTKFTNRRAEAWYNTRELFRKDLINIPSDESLIGQLTSPKYDFDAAGRYRLESKEKIKGRGLQSPDRADALVMAFSQEAFFSSTIASDIENRETIKKGTVSEILRELERKEVDEIKWHSMSF